MAIILQKSPAVNYLVSALIVLYMAGLLTFHLVGNFDYDPIWDKVYYLWDDSKDLLFWIVLLGLKREYYFVIVPIIGYAFVRLCFETATTIMGRSPNAWWVVDPLFIILLCILIGLTIYQRLKK